MKFLYICLYIAIFIALKSQAQESIIFKDFYIDLHAASKLDSQLNASILTDQFDEMLITKYPFDAYKGRAMTDNEPFLPEYWDKISFHLYNNLNTSKKEFLNRTESFFTRRFNPTNGNYYLINAHYIGYGTKCQKDLLITYNSMGQYLDNLETCITFYPIYLKQYKLTSDMQVIVYHLNLQPTDFIEEPPYTHSRHGQRIDTYYQIESTGKFRKVKEIRYKPQVYTADYLNDKTVNIWEGQEEKMPSAQ